MVNQRICSIDSFYAMRGSPLRVIVSVLPSLPMYKFSTEDPDIIDDALAFRILDIAARRMGIREISFARSSRFDFAEVGSMDLPELDLTVMSLGFNSDRCRIEGGFLYGDDQVKNAVGMEHLCKWRITTPHP